MVWPTAERSSNAAVLLIWLARQVSRPAVIDASPIASAMSFFVVSVDTW